MHGVLPRMIAASARPRIGRLDVIRRDFAAGVSLADMAQAFAADMPPEFFAMGVAVVDDGEPLEPPHWPATVPQPGQSVAFVILPGLGGKIGQVFAQVAVIAAQAFAYTIPGVGPLVAAGIGLAGSALLGAAQTKKKPKKSKAPKQLGEAGFSDNTLAPYEQLATVLGIRRVPAVFMAPPVVVMDDQSAVGRAVVALAGRHELSLPLLAGIDPDFPDENTREGDASDLDPTIYTTVQWQEQPGELSRHVNLMAPATDARVLLAHTPDATNTDLYDLPKFHYFRMGNRRFPDRLILDFLFDQGLYRIDSNGKGDVALQFSFWKDGVGIYLPEIHVSANYKSSLRAKLVIEFGPDPGGITAPSSANIWREAYANSSVQSLLGYAAHTYYGTSAVSTHVGVSGNVCTIYCDPASIPLDGTYSFAVKIGCGVLGGEMIYATNQYDQLHSGSSARGEYFTAVSGPPVGELVSLEDQALVQSHLIFEQLSREYDTDAIVPDGIATYEIQTKNQTVSQLSIMAARYVDKRWDGSAWVAEPHISNNPGELLYDVLTNSNAALLARPLSASLVNGAELGAWADFCTLNGFTCNAYIDGGSLEDAIATICEAGHAYLKRSKTWGVYIEQSRSGETPVMVFSPRNSRGFTVEKSFDHKPHAFRVTFDDEDDDYQTKPDLVVYAAGYDEFSATLFEARNYPGITQEWQAIARAELDLAIIYYRDKTYSLETDARYLVAERGSLVGINHFVLDEAHGFAAIRAVTRQEVGGVTKITGLLLDTDLDMQSGTTGIAISTNAGEVVAAQSSQIAKVRELVFSTPLTDDPEIEAGCTITSGVVSSEYISCIVDDIKPGAGGMARLILVDEAPEIHGAVVNDLYSSPDLYGETDLYNLA